MMTAMMMTMVVMMMLRRMMFRRKTDPKTGKHTLCEPAEPMDMSQEPFSVRVKK